MNLKNLFGRKATPAPVSLRPSAEISAKKLDADSLDDCVGGRTETNGVGCYLGTAQPRVH
jgi:hypothetical protein